MLRFNMWNSAFMLSQHAAVYPADVVKTRVQIGQSARSETAAMLKQARAIVAESGAGGLYRGFGWAAAPLAAQEALYYSTYAYTKRLLVDAGAAADRESAEFAAPFLAGAMAEAACTCLSVPTDVVTQRLQILPAGSPLSGPAVVRAVVAEQGPGGLMRGTTATLVAYVPYSAVWFGSYECAKRAGGGLVASGDSQGSGVHMLHAGSGALAGIMATVVSNPLDVVKTRIQTNGAPSYLTQPAAPLTAIASRREQWLAGRAAMLGGCHPPGPWLQAARFQSSMPAALTPTCADTGLSAIRAGLAKILKEEGVRGLMRGVVPRALTNAPTSAFSLVLYELAVSLATIEPG